MRKAVIDLGDKSNCHISRDNPSQQERQDRANRTEGLDRLGIKYSVYVHSDRHAKIEIHQIVYQQDQKESNFVVYATELLFTAQARRACLQDKDVTHNSILSPYQGLTNSTKGLSGVGSDLVLG